MPHIDRNGNLWHTHPEPKGVTDPASFHDKEHYRKQCEALTGGRFIPAVMYKGEIIPAHEF